MEGVGGNQQGSQVRGVLYDSTVCLKAEDRACEHVVLTKKDRGLQVRTCEDVVLTNKDPVYQGVRGTKEVPVVRI